MITSKNNIQLGKVFELIFSKNYQFENAQECSIFLFEKFDRYSSYKCKNIMIEPCGTINVSLDIPFQIVKYEVSGKIKWIGNYHKKKSCYKTVYYPQFGVKVGDIFRIYRCQNQEETDFDHDYQKMYKKILKVNIDYDDNPIMESTSTKINTLDQFANQVVLFSNFDHIYKELKRLRNLSNVSKEKKDKAFQEYIIKMMNDVILSFTKTKLQEYVNIYYFGRPTFEQEETIIEFDEPMNIMDIGEKYFNDDGSYNIIKRMYNRKVKNDVADYVFKNYDEFENQIKTIKCEDFDHIYFNSISKYSRIFKDLYYELKSRNKKIYYSHGFYHDSRKVKKRVYFRKFIKDEVENFSNGTYYPDDEVFFN